MESDINIKYIAELSRLELCLHSLNFVQFDKLYILGAVERR